MITVSFSPLMAGVAVYRWYADRIALESSAGRGHGMDPDSLEMRFTLCSNIFP